MDSWSVPHLGILWIILLKTLAYKSLFGHAFAFLLGGHLSPNCCGILHCHNQSPINGHLVFPRFHRHKPHHSGLLHPSALGMCARREMAGSQDMYILYLLNCCQMTTWQSRLLFKGTGNGGRESAREMKRERKGEEKRERSLWKHRGQSKDGATIVGNKLEFITYFTDEGNAA